MTAYKCMEQQKLRSCQNVEAYVEGQAWHLLSRDLHPPDAIGLDACSYPVSVNNAVLCPCSTAPGKLRSLLSAEKREVGVTCGVLEVHQKVPTLVALHDPETLFRGPFAPRSTSISIHLGSST